MFSITRVMSRQKNAKLSLLTMPIYVYRKRIPAYTAGIPLWWAELKSWVRGGQEPSHSGTNSALGQYGLHYHHLTFPWPFDCRKRFYNTNRINHKYFFNTETQYSASLFTFFNKSLWWNRLWWNNHYHGDPKKRFFNSPIRVHSGQRLSLNFSLYC